MASILSSLSGQTKLYEPSPRFGHGAAAVGGRYYLWGGRVQDFSASGRRRRKLTSTVDIFDPYLETWEEHHTTGVPPPGLYLGACTSLLDSLYWFGGYDASSFYNSFHRLDTTTLKWRELQPLNQADGPMRKSGCGMVPFLQDQLAVFGGHGIPIGPTQPGAMFTKGTNTTDGSGWSNELHVFTITEGMWGQYYLHMMRDRQQVSLCSIGWEEYLDSLYTEFHFLQVLLRLLIPCMSRISTSASTGNFS